MPLLARLSRWLERARARLGAGVSWPPTPRWQAYAVVLLTMALRATWVSAVPSHPVGDFALYMESAEDLVEGGRLDDHFIYMPGYVLALAAIKWLGGGLLACKLLSVAAAGLGAIGVLLLAARAGGPRVAWLAGLLYALWPAGIAVCSVTGTDAPTGSLVVLAVGLLVELAARRRFWQAALVFGLTMGLAAWIRAVALPLSAFSFFVLRAHGAGLRRASSGLLISVCAATLVLAPWALRNHARYGAWFLTDSHGGHTALVGSNPNTEGAYGRSLNRLFTDVTGYRLLDEPARHRASDHAAYELAKQLVRFEPSYALGLLALKADRLLSHERTLLYWPLYRQGVLRNEARARADTWRPALELLTDAAWFALVGLSLGGAILAVFLGRRDLTAWLPFPVLLASIYVLFFAEVRYHLAFAPFLFPLAAWFLERTRVEGRRVWPALLGAAALMGLAWPAFLHLGEGLRERHRFAATELRVADKPSLALWRRTPPLEGPSPVRGTGNMLGLQWSTERPANAETRLPLLDPSNLPQDGADEEQWILKWSAMSVLESGNNRGADLSSADASGPLLSVKVDDQLVFRGVLGRHAETFMAPMTFSKRTAHTLAVQVEGRGARASQTPREGRVFIDDMRLVPRKEGDRGL